MKLWLPIRAELVCLQSALRAPLLVLLLALGGVGVAAYRVPFSYTLDIGGTPGGRIYDRPFLHAGFNYVGGEPESDSPVRAFRWAFEDARLVFPGVGRAVHMATLRVAAAHPGPDPVPSGWQIGPTPLTVVPLARGPRVYHLLLPAAGPDLDLRLHTPTFQPPNDPRALGFAADAFSFRPGTPALPAAAPLGWLAGCLVAGYLLVRRWGLPEWVSAGAGAAAVLAFGVLLAVERLGITTFAPRLLATLLAAYGGTVVLLPVLRAAVRALRVAAAPSEVRSVAALAMLAWAIRLGGLLHPQAYTSDLGLHANNLRGVTGGEIIFTETLPGEAGGGPAPYPPAQYVMLLPLRLLLGPERLIEAGSTLADSLFIVSGWLLLRTAGTSARTALFAGGLYLFATPLLVSLSIGEMANVWGQALVGPLLLVLYGWHAGVLPTWGLGAAFGIAFLGHSGVFLSLLLFFAIYLALLLLRHGPWAKLAGVLALALLVVVAVYYSSFARSLAADSGSARVPFGLGRVRHELVLSLGLMGRTGPLNAGLGLAGLALLFRRVPEGRAMELLWVLLLAWWLSALLSLGTLLWTQQALRWQAFLFPALALCGGVALAALHHRGRARRALAYALLTIMVVRGAVLWYVQIATYQH